MTTTAPPRTVITLVNFKEIKARVTIVQILERYDLMPTLKQSGDRLSGPCPIHRGTNTTQFRVSISKNCFNCFGDCGRGGNVIDFVSLRENVPFREAALLLQEWFMPEKATAKVAETPPMPYASCPPLPPDKDPPVTVGTGNDSSDAGEAGENPPLDFVLKSLKQDHPYLAERGLTESTVKSYGMGYCSKGCLRGYVAIPIRNRDGAIVAYIGRWPGEPPDDKPKYKLPKGFKKSLELFNIDMAAKIDSSVPLIVVEGVFDCLRLVQFGYPRTVALLGSSLSERQEILIRDAAGPSGHIYLMLDADEAGRHGAAEASSRLCRTSHVRTINIGQYQNQPDQLERHQLDALIRTT